MIKLKNKLTTFFKTNFFGFANIGLLATFTLLLSFCNPNTTNGGSDNDRELERRQAIINSLNMSNNNSQNIISILQDFILDNSSISSVSQETCERIVVFHYNTVNNECVRSYALVNVINNSNGGNFSNPLGIAVDDDYIYVLDDGRGNVQIFNKSNRMNVYNISNIVGITSGIAIDNHFIYVTDTSSQNRVQIFNKSSRMNMYTIDSSSGNFSQPHSIAVDNTSIYVTNLGSSMLSRTNVQILDKSNRMRIDTIGNFSQTTLVFGIALDANYIYITQSSNGTLHIFNKSSRIRVHTISGLSVPIGVAVDNNYIYVTNNTPGNLQIFNKSSRMRVHNINGLNTPGGVAVDNNYIYVTGNDNVQIFNK